METNSSLIELGLHHLANPLPASSGLINRWWLVVSSLLILAVVTRLLSGYQGISKVAANGVKTVPMAPYWLPVVGHIGNLGLAPDHLFAWTRKVYNKGVFSLNLGGTTHNVIFNPALGAALMGQNSSVADAEHVSKYLMMTNFGFPRAESDKYDEAIKDILGCYKHLMSEPSLGNMVDSTVDVLKTNIANLVTFSTSIVDQHYWERTNDTRVVTTPSGEQVVETSLLPLLREFVAFTANPSLVGTDFLQNFPDIFSNLWIMDQGFRYLATGLPRWTPFPPLTRAHIGLRQMMRASSAFHVAMEKKANGEDPGAEWSDLDNVGALVKARMEQYRKHDFSIEARAACEVALLWAMNANANPLVFWMLNRIYADKVLLEQIREEVAPYVRAVQPTQEFAVPEQPRLESLDHDALATKCPLLKSCYIESLRIDTGVWSFKVMRQDLVLSGRGKEAEEADKFLLKKGTYAHFAADLHHTNPDYFDEPRAWKADRHIKYEEAAEKGGERKATVDMGTVRPYGGGQSMCKGRFFAQKEALMFTAVIATFWDMEAAGGGVWKLPRPKNATGTKSTNDDVRVWIKRRALPQS